MKHLKAFIILAILLSGCATSERTKYTQLNPRYDENPKEINLILNAYPLKSPGPTVIYAHGCSGLDGAYLDWKNKLNDWGYNVVQPDSLRSRGVSTACNKIGVINVTHSERVEDIIETAKWIKQQSWHKGKIGIIGFSMGGIAVLNLISNGGNLHIYTSKTDKDIFLNKDISAGVAYYPFCGLNHRHATVPTLILIGEADAWTPPTWCGILAESNNNIFLKTYPAVYHSFDTPGFNQINQYGHMIKYDAAAAADAERRTREFFEKYLKNNF